MSTPNIVTTKQETVLAQLADHLSWADWQFLPEQNELDISSVISATAESKILCLDFRLRWLSYSHYTLLSKWIHGFYLQISRAQDRVNPRVTTWAKVCGRLRREWEGTVNGLIRAPAVHSAAVDGSHSSYSQISSSPIATTDAIQMFLGWSK